MSKKYTPQEYKNFTHNLSELMRHYKVTQHQLASDMGLSQPSMCRWIRGYGFPTSDKLLELATYFKTTVEGLLVDGLKLPVVSTQTLLKEVSIEELISAINSRGFAITLYPIMETKE